MEYYICKQKHWANVRDILKYIKKNIKIKINSIAVDFTAEA